MTAPSPEGTLTIIAPEGAPLYFRLADNGARAAAFLIDCAAMFGLVLVLSLLVGLTNFGGGEGWSTAVGYLFFFLVRQFYFAFFELRWHGQTPGKRSQGLRVIDARGGALRPEAVLGRNLTRDLEVFLPLVLLMAPEAIFPGVTGGARVAASLWALVFALLPLFNKQRVRVGDLVGGTRVVAAPKGVLLEELGAARPDPKGRTAAYTFTPEMLVHYGIFELQKLEELLRAPEKHTGEVLAEVAAKIVRRIGFPDAKVTSAPVPFLRAFYAAQRAHLEQKAVMGERIVDKGAARTRKGTEPRRR